MKNDPVFVHKYINMYIKIIQNHNNMLIFIKKQKNYAQFSIKRRKKKLKNKTLTLKSCKKMIIY